MRYYRSGNWLWAIGQVWAILLTGGLAFSGISARLRTLAQRMGSMEKPLLRLATSLGPVTGLAARFRSSMEWDDSRGCPHKVATRLQAENEETGPVRDDPRRVGLGWFLTIGLYVIMYLGIVFVLNLPLAF